MNSVQQKDYFKAVPEDTNSNKKHSSQMKQSMWKKSDPFDGNIIVGNANTVTSQVDQTKIN